jgi:SAM-dependent methyltransferase
MTAENDAPGPGSSNKRRRPLKKRPSFDRKAILVLGMHRSGTSALSGLLATIGCDGPANPMPATSMNPKGYFESDPIYRLHEEMFLSAGTSWDDFRPFPQDWLHSPKADEFRSKMQEVVASEYGDSSLFVVKDPRICRIVPFWSDVLVGMGIQPLAVHTHRNPLEVATSLVERDLMDRAYGEFLWLCHVIEAEHGSRQLPRAFTSYDRLLKNWVPEVRRLSKALGLTWPRFTAANASTHENFVEPKLRHFVSDPGAVLENDLLSDWIRDTFSILENWAADGASAADYPKLDAVGCGAGYKEASLLTSGLVQEFFLYEISGERVQQGKAFAKSRGIEHRMHFVQEDAFVSCRDHFDLVYWNNALHHMMDVPAAISWSRDRLAPDGVFAMDDYVGASRFQWSDYSLHVATRFREALSADQLGNNPSRVARPSLEKLIEMDPSEAADSERTVPALRSTFTNLQYFPTGGAIYHPALNDVLTNIEEESEALSLALLLDEVLARQGETHYGVAIAKRA